MAKKEPFSLFNVKAENFSTNTLGLKTPKQSKEVNAHSDKGKEHSPPHDCKKELSEIIYDYKTLYTDLNNFHSTFKEKLLGLERRLFDLMKDH